MEIALLPVSNKKMLYGLPPVKIKYPIDFSPESTGYFQPPELFYGHPFVNWAEIINNSARQNTLRYKTFKYLTDLIFSFLITLLLLSWLIPLIALGIKLDSAGPVFFLQKRKGLDGRSFICIKFRSMYVNDQSDVKPAEVGDPRITPFGRFLRKYYIDELPQFINVLWGSMTIVGPRPHMVTENDYYEKYIPDYSFRYKVKPGITGLGQVNNRNCLSGLEKMKKRIFWDTLYIKNWSQHLDLWIIYKTICFCVRSGNHLHS
ncbi:MAG: hypothetical protein EPN39_11245 [Chitinophagaceae bacterium]|nr:MAG: hypothetical protein EPN39_11245 [Chitinophagaceae bacterium]